MRINTGMAYKRRVRAAKIRRKKKEMLFWEKASYSGDGKSVGMSFAEYLDNDPHVKECVRTAGIYAKGRYHAGSSSTAWRGDFNYSFYPCRDIRRAEDAIFEYDELDLPEDTINRSEAQRKVHNSDRKVAKHRKIY